MKFAHTALATAIGVMIGLVAGHWLHEDSDPPAQTTRVPIERVDTQSVGRSAAETGLAAFRNELAFERDARFAMAEELDLIWDELASRSAADGAIELSPSAKNPNRTTPPTDTNDSPAFNSRSLLKAGVSEHDVERLKERYEAEQLDELYLRDVATREGWVSTQRFRNERKLLLQDLRVELGDEDYDRLRFASGRNNRVLINDVLQNSAASAAGLRKGDVVVRYDGEILLTPQDLRDATVGGSAGVTTSIDVLRGNETLRIYVPRGPLGVRIGRTRRLPE